MTGSQAGPELRGQALVVAAPPASRVQLPPVAVVELLPTSTTVRSRGRQPGRT